MPLGKPSELDVYQEYAESCDEDKSVKKLLLALVVMIVFILTAVVFCFANIDRVTIYKNHFKYDDLSTSQLSLSFDELISNINEVSSSKKFTPGVGVSNFEYTTFISGDYEKNITMLVLRSKSIKYTKAWKNGKIETYDLKFNNFIEYVKYSFWIKKEFDRSVKKSKLFNSHYKENVKNRIFDSGEENE